MRQPTDALGRISCPLRSRGSHLESGALFPLTLYLAVTDPGVWVLLLSTENEILREMTISVGAILGSTVDTCSATVRWGLWTHSHMFLVAADSDPEAFFSIRFEWISVPSRCYESHDAGVMMMIGWAHHTGDELN